MDDSVNLLRDGHLYLYNKLSYGTNRINVIERVEAEGDTASKTSQFFKTRFLLEQDRLQQERLMKQLHQQFRVSGDEFNKPGIVAFKDQGARLITTFNDDQVAQAMVTMTEAKGWKAIKISGHPEFQRKVWMEASLRGLDVQGYKPTEQDLQQLDDKCSSVRDNAKVSAPANQIDQSIQEDNKNQPNNVAREEPVMYVTSIDEYGDNKLVSIDRHGREVPISYDEDAHIQRNKMNLEASDQTRRSNNKVQNEENVENTTPNVHTGRVLKYGGAHYHFDPKENLNFYVKLETNEGNRTIWGVDLARGMGEKKIKIGDHVTLEYQGSKLVVVDAPKRDEKGDVIGREPIATPRNTWSVTKLDKSQVVDAVASKLINSTVQNPQQRETLQEAIRTRIEERQRANQITNVVMFDKNAQAKSSRQERPNPVSEQHRERTR